MNSHSPNRIVGGFADPVPAPLASLRHLRRFIYIALGIAIAMLLQARQATPTPAISRVPMYFALIAVEVLLVWFVAIGIRAYGYKLRDLFGRGWRSASNGLIDLILAGTTTALLRFLGPALYQVLGRWHAATGFLLPKSGWESVAWIAVSAAAGFCEEAVYRGYLQRQLWSLTRSLTAALFLQAVVFGAAHIYQGWKPTLVAAIYGLIFGLVAAWRRSLVPGAIAHTVVDVLGGLRL